MNGNALLGIVAIIYALLVFFITYKKPEKVWDMPKIKGFEKVFGEKGTVIFFYIVGLLAAGLGVWLLMK